MGTGNRREAFPAYHFEVVIDQVTLPFRSCSGLRSETKVIELEEGGVNGHTRKLVGQTTFPNLVLKQGFCDPSSPLYKLRLGFLSGERKRFSGVVRQIGPHGTEAKWQFSDGWICKWEGPELDASKNEISIETIEIAHEGLTLLSAGAAGEGKKQ